MSFKNYSFLLLSSLALSLSACSSPQPNDGNTAKVESPIEQGKKVFSKNCVTCHGANGKLGLGGAKDLSTSALNHAERVQVISNGRNTMQAWKSLLTPQEIDDVAAYTLTLK